MPSWDLTSQTPLHKQRGCQEQDLIISVFFLWLCLETPRQDL